ncbi:hypothetical protein PROFUN_09455 [Planoprotostelium fungivorum]|uniref:Uncharacterized protein n=1 Tax=Planoprotostelium fungivorum TaxID=1890364 RepID=A0A2P6NH06_9EUKA|nr:hypothetical protein PROFUN_09455 [Planoprotostelium fungivorum]
MDVDETYNGVPELFGSPRQASPPRPLSPTSECPRACCQAANAPPHRESLPAPLRRRGPRPPSGCQFVYANPDTRCKLRGPRRTGSDGKVYCEAHIEDGRSVLRIPSLSLERNHASAEAQRRGTKYSQCCCLATDCIEQFINLQNLYCLDNNTNIRTIHTRDSSSSRM